MFVNQIQQNILFYSKFSLLLWLSLCFPIFGSAQFSYDPAQIQTVQWTPKPSFVQGVHSPVDNLDNNWQFAVASDVAMPALSRLKFDSITVPGEWTMQGYHVKDEEYGVYKKTFSIPEDWQNNTIKLQFEAVYSECEIWLNGAKIGEHYTGFTGFEFDISTHVKTNGENVLYVIIKGKSNSDNLSSASTYAVHYLGGISRDVSLLTLPRSHISSFHGTTVFDSIYSDADLKMDLHLENQSNTSIELGLEYVLRDHNNAIVTSFTETPIVVPALAVKPISSIIPIKNPKQWNPETPYLYTVEAVLSHNSKIIQKTSKKIGFKQTEIRGNRVFVNNKPIKLRGVNRHDVHPETGRVLRGNQWFEDVRLFKEGNVNYIRTSHYPPSQKLLEACDELGMFVEVEAPFCWASKKFVDDSNYFDQILRPSLEMVEMFKTHPSILHWSMANESHDFEELFKESSRLIKIADPSRPRVFSQWGPDADNGNLELANHHYPGSLEAVDQYKDYKRPIVFDEYMHLNAYNRKELATDPGLRDFWGVLFREMWEKMYETPAVLGGAIWSGIDDSFVLPNGVAVGYGTWGPLDGWRREKPEYWHMKKVYSPIKIELIETTSDGVSLSIENRNFFSNIKNFPIEWKNGAESGILTLDIEPQTKDTISLALKDFSASGLYIDVHSPEQDYMIDRYHFKIVSSPTVDITLKGKKLKTSITDTEIVFSDGELKYTFDKNTGGFTAHTKNSSEIIKGLPQLLLLPITGEGGGIQMTMQTLDYPIFSPPCANRIVNKISIESILKDKIELVIEESYDEALGIQKWTFTPGGIINIEYQYSVKQDLNPRQVGLIFEFPKEYNTLTWSRTGLWSVYPEHHIGRLSGTATTDTSIEISGLAGPLKWPDNYWFLDRTISGSNDFRSTKRNIYQVSLSNPSGNSFSVYSSGLQSSRAWESTESSHLLIADFDNPGGERFLRTFGKDWDKKLKRGDLISGKIKIQL